MAVGDPYATRAELKAYLGNFDNQGTTKDAQLDDALASASREIELHTGRHFNKEITATARVFEATSSRTVSTDDFWTTTGLIIQHRGGDSFGTAWSATDYELLPLNGEQDGQTVPYNLVHSVNVAFPNRRYATHYGSLQVTAQWGWASVPAPIKQACLLMAAQNYKMSEAPFGVAGFSDFGVVRIRDLPLLMPKLQPYVRSPILVG